MIETLEMIIDNIIAQKIPNDKRKIILWLNDLTRFVDGIVAKTDEYIEYKNPADLTSYEVVYFPLTDLQSALALSYAVGSDNSLVLNQKYQVNEGRVEFDTSSTAIKELEPEPAESEYNGFLVVICNSTKYTPEEVEYRLISPDYRLICNKQNAIVDKFNSILSTFSKDYDMTNNKIISLMQEYKFAEAKSLLPPAIHRRDVIWSGELF